MIIPLCSKEAVCCITRHNKTPACFVSLICTRNFVEGIIVLCWNNWNHIFLEISTLFSKWWNFFFLNVALNRLCINPFQQLDCALDVSLEHLLTRNHSQLFKQGDMDSFRWLHTHKNAYALESGYKGCGAYRVNVMLCSHLARKWEEAIFLGGYFQFGIHTHDVQ